MSGMVMEFNAASRTFVPRCFEIPVPSADEVVVRVKCCTICGSDLHTHAGRRSAPNRCVLGHEIVGQIERYHPDSPPRDEQERELVAGDRVTWTMAVGCGRCFYCQNGLGQKCPRVFKYGHEPGGDRPTGGLSTHCVLVPGTRLFRIPSDLSDAVAAPANCATATVAAAYRLVRQTHDIEGATVMIMGAGMLGLTAAVMARESGASSIVMVDHDQHRLATAMSFGATETLSALADVVATVREMTSGRGPDVVLDFAGPNESVLQCLETVRTGGLVLLGGSTFPAGAMDVFAEQILRRMLTIRGLHNYLPEDLGNALRFLSESQHQYPFESLVARSFPLEQVTEAFAFAHAERPVRVACHAI